MVLHPSSEEFRAMLRAYMVCLLWTMPGDDKEESPGDRFTPERFTNEARTVCAADCLEFLNRLQRAKLAPYVWSMRDASPSHDMGSYSFGQMGHDLALSRNGHGAGFFDRDALREELRDQWQDIARDMGERDVYAAQGWIHVS